MAKSNIRDKLVAAGLELFHTKGYNACGVSDITDAAEVPKGSFYNHFKSKELLALAVLDLYQSMLGRLPKWKNQILIDGVNPFHGKAGNFTPANVGNMSTSQFVEALAPGARVVKAFNHMLVSNLEADPVVNGARRVAFISADDDGAKKRVQALLENCGYSVVDLGNLRDGGLIQQAGGPIAGRDFFERG